MSRVLRVSASLIAVALVAGQAAGQGFFGEATSDPQVDVVAKTTVRLAPDHTEAYQNALHTQAERCLGGVISTSDRGAEPKDGAAPYRLFIEHTAVIEVAKATSSERVQGENLVGRFMVSQDKGTYRFRLARWQDNKYVPVDTWMNPYVRMHYTSVSSSPSSKEMEGLRKIALMECMPKDANPGVLNHILPMKLAVGGSPGQSRPIQVTLQNRALWPLKKMTAVLSFPEQRGVSEFRYRAEIMYDGLLMPGQQVTINSTAAARSVFFKYEKTMPMEIDALPIFDAKRGPEWVNRQIEAAGGQNPEDRQKALAALDTLVPQMAPEEAAAMTTGLLDMMAHDAPVAESDIPAGSLALLVKLGNRATQALSNALKSPNDGIRLGATLVLQQVKVTDKMVLTRLRDLVRDKNEVLSAAARKALEANGQQAPPQ